MKHTIGLLDEHNIFRSGLIELIHNHTLFKVIIDTGNIVEFDRMLFRKQPGVVIIRIKSLNNNLLNDINKFLSNYPEIKLIIIINNKCELRFLNQFDLPLHGYLHENSEITELYELLIKIENDPNFDNEYRDLMFKSKQQDVVHEKQLLDKSLTFREREVLDYICQGFTNSEIAKKIFLSKRTIEIHRGSLLHKTGVRNTAGLVAWAYRYKVMV